MKIHSFALAFLMVVILVGAGCNSNSQTPASTASEASATPGTDPYALAAKQRAATEHVPTQSQTPGSPAPQ